MEENKKEKKVENEKKFEQVKPETKKVEGIKKETAKQKETMVKEKGNTDKKEKKEKKNRTKGIIARIIAMAIILTVIIILIYMAMPSPSRAVEQMLTDLKQGKFEEVEEYVEYEKLANVSVLEIGENSENQENQKLFYEELEWKIKRIEQKAEEATVEIETTNKDYQKIFQNYMKVIIQKAFNQEEISSEKSSEYLINELSKENVETKTTTQKLTVKKEEGKWKVEVNEALRNAIYPGLSDAINAIGN